MTNTTNTTKKVTKTDMFNRLLTIEAVANDSEMVAFINHELELLAKKRSNSSSGMTKTQKENVSIKEDIKLVLAENGSPMINSDITKAMQALKSEYANISPQKVASLITIMKKEGQIIRTQEKKQAYFSLA